MRSLKLSALMAVLVLGLAIPWVSSATHGNGNGPKKDMVDGTGQVDGGANQVHINAQLKKDGTAQGQVVHHVSLPAVMVKFSGPVTCLKVAGNLADVAIVIDKTDSPVLFPVGQVVNYTFEDGGEPGAGQDRLDGSFDKPPCERLPNLRPIEQGNYIVHDG